MLASNLPKPDHEYGFVPIGPFGYAPWLDYAKVRRALANATRELVPSATRVVVQVALEEGAGDPDHACRFGRLHGWRAVFVDDEEGEVEVDLLEKVRADRDRFEIHLETADFYLPGFWFGHALREEPDLDRAGTNLHHAAELLSKGGAACQRLITLSLDVASPLEFEEG